MSKVLSNLEVNISFNPQYEGTMQTDAGEFSLGAGIGDLSPYPMLLGALGTCYFHTFLEIVRKKRIDFDHVEIEVSGEKREEVPTTLKHVKIIFKIFGAGSDETTRNKFLKSCELAEKYCSIHATVSKVAEVETEVVFA